MRYTRSTRGWPRSGLFKITVYQGLRTAVYNALARSRLLRELRTALPKATGWRMTFISPDEARKRSGCALTESRFCVLTGRGNEHLCGCAKIARKVLERAGRKLRPCQWSCPAGLWNVAVPVVASGRRHVATLVVGQVLRQQPQRRVFSCRTTCVTPCGLATAQWRRIEKIQSRAPVAPKGQFEAMVEIVKLFAQQLADEVDRLLIACRGGEPPWLSSVRQLVHCANGDTVTMRHAAQRAAMSPTHFCKLFKKTTGMTFTEYVARVRVEKAKSLLRDPFARVTQVAFAAGFGSIPRFNSVFRKLVGMSPTQFRASLQSDYSI